jgi:hypothetical protein
MAAETTGIFRDILLVNREAVETVAGNTLLACGESNTSSNVYASSIVIPESGVNEDNDFLLSLKSAAYYKTVSISQGSNNAAVAPLARANLIARYYFAYNLEVGSMISSRHQLGFVAK